MDRDVCGPCLAAMVRDALQRAPYVPADAVEGVHVLRNRIRLLPRVSASATRERILEALHRDGSDPDHEVDVDVDGESVTLTGEVSSYTERRVAERVARATPQVRHVCNKLRIVHS